MQTIELRERGGCPLCATRGFSVFMPFEIPVVKCDGCGLIYSQKTLSESNLEAYYENNFGSQRHRQGQIVNATVNQFVLERLLDLKKIKNVLDIGTGYGFLISRLAKRYHMAVTGNELSRQEADYAQKELGLNVINRLLGDAGLEKNSFDLVMTFEVVEHVPSPVDFIAELSEYVKPGGYLLVMTDNFESRTVRSLGAGFPKWIPHSHINHFSPATLSKAIGEVKGLEIVKALTYSPWENLLRDAYYRVRGIVKTPAETFNLASVLDTEMGGTYKLFPVRKIANVLWARLNLSSRMDGDLMYFLCRKGF